MWSKDRTRLDSFDSNDGQEKSQIASTSYGPADLPPLFANRTLGKLVLFFSDRRRRIECKMQKKWPVLLSNVNPDGHALMLTNDAKIAQVTLDERIFTKKIDRSDSLLWSLQECLGRNLLTASSDSQEWRRARKFFDPLFSRFATNAHYDSMCKASTEFTRAIAAQEGKVFDPLRMSNRATLHFILSALFSHTSDLFCPSSKDIELSLASRIFMEEAVNNAYIPKPLQMIRGAPRLRWSIKTMDRWIRREMDSRKKGTDKNDLVQALMEKSNGEDDDNDIVRQLILLIIAGHETTGASLAYLLRTVANHADVQERVRQEALEAGFTSQGDFPSSIEALSSLQYTERVILESMRLNGPITGQLRQAREDITVEAGDGSLYRLRKGDRMTILVSALHRNPLYWRSPESFDPDRFLNAEKDSRHPYAFLPFSSGARSCLGRMFAMQEMKIFLASILARFTLPKPPKTTRSDYYGITMRPRQIRIRACPLPITMVKHTKMCTLATEKPEVAGIETTRCARPETQPIVGLQESLSSGVIVAYGSDQGDSFQFAQQCKESLSDSGFEVQLQTLNMLARALKEESFTKAIIVITSTYNGEPPENAIEFSGSMQSQRGAFYAVFGCGNSEWRATYQEFPRKVDGILAASHAQSIVPRGEGDAEKCLHKDWQAWFDQLRSTILSSSGSLPALQCSGKQEKFGAEKVELIWSSSSARTADHAELNAAVVQAERLADCETKVKIELNFDTPVLIAPGDHVLCWPQNDADNVIQCLDAFGLKADDTIMLPSSISRQFGPNSILQTLASRTEPTRIEDLFSFDIDLACAPSSRLLRFVSNECGYEGDARTVGQLIERVPKGSASLSDWLPFLTCIQPRRYSIANASSALSTTIELFMSVVPDGFCSRFITSATAGLRLRACHRPSAFRPERARPMIMVAAGTGLAPFMSFIRSHVLLNDSNELTLIYGSRTAADCLCHDELVDHAQSGVLKHLFFARSQEHLTAQQQKYTGDVIVKQSRDIARQIVEQNASVYICGQARTVAKDARSALYKALAFTYGAQMADDTVKEMESSRRIVEDLWT